MKNFKTFYEKTDVERYEELTEQEPKERRNKKFRDKRDVEYGDSLDRYSRRFIEKQNRNLPANN